MSLPPLHRRSSGGHALRSRRLAAAGLVLLLAAPLASCRSVLLGQPLDLRLSYLPSEPPDRSEAIGLRPFPPGTRVWVDAVVDLRNLPHDIGLSVEGGNTPVRVAAEGPRPGEFVRSVVNTAMPAFQVPVADDVESASHILQMHLVKFWVTEESTYAGEIMVDARLLDRSGAILWEDSLSSVSRRWGKTFKEENFLASYSDATLELTEELALREDFRAALSGT